MRRLGLVRGTCFATLAFALACGASGACTPPLAQTPERASDRRSRSPQADAAAPADIADGQAPHEGPTRALMAVTVGPGFPAPGPWVSFYGRAAQMGDLAKVASTFRIINIDADLGAQNFSDEQLRVLKAGGKNRVLSYLNIGACEHYRTYWSTAPAGLSSCSANKAAQRGAYEGYADETWMDPGDESYQKLLLEHVAPRLAARVDGFYLDNLEILEHAAMSRNGPCSASCRQGGLDFVRKLRDKFPSHLIVMQNATSDVTRMGTTGGVRFATLLDGVAHEEVYAPKHDTSAEAELLAWKAMSLTNLDGRPFWIAVEDYVGNCTNDGAAHAALAKARARDFAPYVSDESGAQKTVCYWE